MDSGFALRAPRNDEVWGGSRLALQPIALEALPSRIPWMHAAGGLRGWRD